MASYRPYAPPQSSFPPQPPLSTNPLPPPLHPQPPRGQYSQNWGYGGSGNSGGGDGSNYYQQQPYSSSSRQPQQPPPPHYPYAQPPPPPPPDSSYPPPPPPPPGQNSVSLQPPQPPSTYYASTSQYSQYNSQQVPPPPSSPPPNSVIPPPPPPSSPPPPPHPQSKDSRGPDKKPQELSKGPSRGRFDQAKQTKPPVPAARKPNGNPRKAETEEERRLRKKREYEKLRQEEKHKQQLKESQNSILQKARNLSSGKGHGSIVGSRMGDRRATPFLGGDRTENRLKKPTTFLCKMKFRNELPDPSAQMKLMSLKKDKERFTKYTITSLEKTWKPKLYVEPDLGIPLDLLDLSVYNPPAVRTSLAPEDEELLYDDAVSTPIKNSGIKRKERPADKGMSWLVKTQYISPISLESAKQSLTEKQAKELKDSKGRNILDNLNSRGRQIKEIEASFVSAKTRPVHATNKNLYPVEVWPLFPDFDRYKDPLVVASFDSAPTADAQTFSKLDQPTRDEHESKALMKSYMASGSDPSNPEKFLAYIVPSTDELSKDPFDEDEDINYTWIREYNWDVRGDDVDDPTTYLVAFDDGEARYLPLPTKLNLRKKRAREGRAGEEVEHFPVPASITVRRRPNVASIELKDESGQGYSNRKGSSKMMRDDEEDGLDESPEREDYRQRDVDQYSGVVEEEEEDMSD